MTVRRIRNKIHDTHRNYSRDVLEETLAHITRIRIVRLLVPIALRLISLSPLRSVPEPDLKLYTELYVLFFPLLSP